MKPLKIIVILFIISSCSPKISEHFESNSYIRQHGLSIYNDDLQLYLYTPGDIVYITERNELQKLLRKNTFHTKDSVLIYGIADDPKYEYFVTVSDVNSQNAYKDYVYYDTILNAKKYNFIGNPIETHSKKTLEIDLKNIRNSIVVGNNYKKDSTTLWDVSNRFNNSNKYLNAYREVSLFPVYNRQDEWTKLQLELTYASFLGVENHYYTEKLSELESRFQPNDTIVNIILKNKNLYQNPLEKIIAEASKTQLLMINENHFYPNQRFLVLDLLDDLKKNGFTYLALETLGENQDSVLNKKESVLDIESGYYTREQNYSNLIRKAKELEFEFVAYENFDEKTERELGEAENLYRKTFEKDSTAKVVVLAGIAHIEENQISTNKKRMATIFKEKFHINPLTISQTHLNSYRSYSPSDYTLLDSQIFGDKLSGLVDFIVLNNRKEVQTFEKFFDYENKYDEEVQLMLFLESELSDVYDYQKKIPYFITLLKKNEKKSLPIIKDGNILLVTYDKNSKLIDKKTIRPQNK